MKAQTISRKIKGTITTYSILHLTGEFAGQIEKGKTIKTPYKVRFKKGRVKAELDRLERLLNKETSKNKTTKYRVVEIEDCKDYSYSAIMSLDYYLKHAKIIDD